MREVPVQFLTRIGSVEDELRRSRHVVGLEEGDGYLLRSLSSSMISQGRVGLAILPPSIEGTWNSAIPRSLNEGIGWSGRGLSASAAAGAGIRWGPLRLVIAPEAGYSENRQFEIVDNPLGDRSDYSLHWFADTTSIDMPVRFGDSAVNVSELGQSSVSLGYAGVAAGVGTENHWWGPGVRNAIVLSNNARGFPHAFLRTTRPLRTSIGNFEAIWLAGELAASEYFIPARDSLRSISAFAATFSPSFEPDLYLGIARSVYVQRDTTSGVTDAADDVFTDWGGETRAHQGQAGEAFRAARLAVRSVGVPGGGL